jgi:leucyl-tRNA synthetase
VVLIAPFCPHIAEELWERLGHNDGLFASARWPKFDRTKALEDTITLAVQVNGKVRATIDLPRGAPEDLALGKAREEPNVARHLQDVALRKVIYVQDRLLNLVVG